MEPPPCRWITPALCPTSSGRESQSWRRAGWAWTAFSTRARCSRNARPASPRLLTPSDARTTGAVILGYFGAGALLSALVMGGFSAVLSFWAGSQENAVMVQVGRRAFYAAAAMIVIAGGVLEWALLGHDFSLAYVTEHTDLSTPTALVAAGFYGGQGRSLLYLALVLRVLGSVSLVAGAALGLKIARYT